jgi:hypothetical protein
MLKFPLPVHPLSLNLRPCSQEIHLPTNPNPLDDRAKLATEKGQIIQSAKLNDFDYINYTLTALC